MTNAEYKGRPCYFKRAPCDNWQGGKFHGWSVECESEQSPNPVGIIEDEKTGEIRTLPVSFIRFQNP